MYVCKGGMEHAYTSNQLADMTEELLRRTQHCHTCTTIHCLRLQWLGHVMRMPSERLARQALFRQPRSTKPVGPLPVSLRHLMRKDVLLLNGGGMRRLGACPALVPTVHGEGCMADYH
jgi:hypothetical protein